MYDIYLKNFYRNGVLVKDEIKLYSVPITEDEVENVLTDPTVSCEIGKTGSFEFSISPNHPYYHSIAQMRTIMRVVYDEDTIFRGRILTVDNTITGVKKIHCEGDMAFLLDSYQMSSKEEGRASISINAYIRNILTEHNRQMGESGETDKYIYSGYIPGNYPNTFSSDQQIANKSDKFGSKSNEQSMNALEALTKEFGGFFRTRYDDSDKKTYLDWCRQWFRKDLDSSQPIAITQNIIDAQSNSEVDNIFTALIPVGKKEGKDIFITGYRTDVHGNNNRILVPQITSVFTDEQLNNGYMNRSLYEKAIERYGIIYKVQSFSNADTQDKLWEYACDWIKNNYVGGITSYDLSAIDMHHIDGHIQKYLAGDCLQIVLPSDMTELDEYIPEKSSTIYRTLLSAKYNLHNPDKNSYTAGISSDILNCEYGVSSTSKSKGGSGKGAGAKGGGNGNNQKAIGGDSQMTQQELEMYAWDYVIDENHNVEEYWKLVAENPSSATAAQKASHINLMRDMEGTEILDDGSVEEKNFGYATTLSLDAQKGIFRILTPFLKILGTDEEDRKITEVNTALALEINGYDQYLTMKGLHSYKDVDDPVINMISQGVHVVDQFNDNFINSLDVFGLRSKAEGALATFFGGTSDNNKQTVTLDGQDGLIGNVMSVLGIDGSGNIELSTIFQNGLGNDGTGTFSIGKEAGKFLINMNEKLKWKDENGSEHEIPNGVIDAQDYAVIKEGGIQAIPSFTAQVGILKTLIAEEINARKGAFNELSADIADIDHLVASVVDATYLHSKSVSVQELTIAANKITINGNRVFTPKQFSSLGLSSWVLAQ